MTKPQDLITTGEAALILGLSSVDNIILRGGLKVVATVSKQRFRLLSRQEVLRLKKERDKR